MRRYVISFNEDSSSGNALIKFLKTLSFVLVEEEENAKEGTGSLLTETNDIVYKSSKSRNLKTPKDFFEDFWSGK